MNKPKTKIEFWFQMTLHMEPTASPDFFQHFIHYDKPDNWGDDEWVAHKVRIELDSLAINWIIWFREERTDLEICRMIAPYLFMEPCQIMSLSPRPEESNDQSIG